MNDLTGKCIKGYELQSQIGKGGFGAVYRAYQSAIGREVAIKVILPKFANTPDFIRRFEIEAQTVARLEQMHIAPLYDYWRDPDGTYLVMRYFRGGSLADALSSGPYDLPSTALMLDQISSALEVAHRSNIIHRDLKPDNILLDEDGNAYLADFGIAKNLNHTDGGITAADAIVGSLDYISPEQARGDQITPHTDIYSLGIVLYETLKGQHPFPGITSIERLYKHLNDPLPKIDTLDEGVREAINTVIQKATAKDPARRYEDALVLAAAFREAARLTGVIPGSAIVEQLTRREQDILRRIVAGMSNKDIAHELFIELTTVKWYITQIYRKLRVRSRMQCIVRAHEMNLLLTEESDSDLTAVSREIITTGLLPDLENPYKGLRPFQVGDTRDFFGREKFTAALVARLAETGDYARFLAVVGPSGSGKSSVVRAGLIPALWRGELPGSEKWFVIDMLPGTHPLDELEIGLMRIAADQAQNLHEPLTRDQRGLLRAAQLILPNDDSELVVMVDQFEEVFTLVENENFRQQFLDLLYTAVIAPRSRVRVVITLRADFYDKPLHYPDFAEMLRCRMETILPLSADELYRAIHKPAEQIGVTFEEGLVSAIVSEIHYQSGALPLLQYALTELFDNRDGRRLTTQAYERVGRAVGALARRAQAVYDEMDKVGQQAARQMFLRLVTLGEGSEDTRRRVARSELLAVIPDSDVMEEVIDIFAAYRLLSLDHDPATRTPVVEVAHEALLREWRLLRDWLDASRSDIRQQRLLAAAALEWQKANGDKSYLLTGARLAQVEAWGSQTNITLTRGERDYLQASIAEHRSQTEKEQQRQAHETALKQRVQRIVQLLAVVSVIAAIIGIALSIFAFSREQHAQESRRKAEREAAVNHSLVLANAAEKWDVKGYPSLALALAMDATSIDDPPADAVSILTTIAHRPGIQALLTGHQHRVRAVTFSPDGQWALSGSCAELTDSGCTQGQIVLWDMATRAEHIRFGGEHTGWINSLVFSPTEPTIALSAADDGALILWNTNTGEAIRRFEGHTGAVNSVSFSPDGQLFISGSADHTVMLWDVTTGDVIRRFEGHTGAVNSVAFSPEGQTFVSGSADTTIILWNVNSGESLQRFEGHTSGINGVAYLSPTTMVSASTDFTIRSWELTTGQEIHQLNAGVTVDCIAVTPDGRSVLNCGNIGAGLWTLDQWTLDYNFSEATSNFYSVAVSPDGHQALFGSEDGTIYLLSLGEQPEVQRFELGGQLLMGVALSPDGRRLLTGTLNEAVLWDVRSGSIIRRFPGQAGVAGILAFSPDGQSALIGASDWFGGTNSTSLVLVDVETGEVIHQLEGHQFFVRAVAFGPDGKTALTGSQKYPESQTDQIAGDLILWDLTTGDIIRRFDTTEDITDIAFSADGQRAITGSSTPIGKIVLWDIVTGDPIREYTTAEFVFYPFSVAFGPLDETILATTGTGYLAMWDTETGQIVPRFAGHEDWAWGLAVSPDGRYVLSGERDGTLILWDFATGHEIRRFNGDPNFVFEIAFSPDGKTAFSAPFAGNWITQWQIAEQSLSDLRAWVRQNRFVRDLTCEERVQYRIEPLCE